MLKISDKPYEKYVVGLVLILLITLDNVDLMDLIIVSIAIDDEKQKYNDCVQTIMTK